MKKILILAALGLALAGCQTAESPRPVLSEITAPQPQPITTRPVAWKVYTAKDIQKLAADMKAGKGQDTVIIGLAPKGYQNLSHNMNEIERYVREQKEVIIFYKNIADERGDLGGQG